MSTTAVVDETRKKTGGPTPSGGAGPVLPLAQGLGELPAEFTANTCWSEAGTAFGFTQSCSEDPRTLILLHWEFRPISLTLNDESFS